MNARTLAFVSLLALTACASGPTHRVDLGPDATQTAPGTVLMVLSAAPTQTLADGSTRDTGYFLNEFYEPYRALVEAGYAVAIATPAGRAPALDPESLNPKYWDGDAEAVARARAAVEALPEMQAPLPLEAVARQADGYQGLVVPGGQGVMVDLLDDPTLHGLLQTFGASHRPVGLICHAPALLTRLPDPAPFAGRRVTSVSGIEEWYIEAFVMGADAQVREIGDRLDDAGFRHEAGFPGRAHAVRDCNLVTSQNPFSGHAFEGLFMAALEDWRRGGRCVPTKAP